MKVIRKLTKAIQELQKANISSQFTKSIEGAPSQSTAPEPQSAPKVPVSLTTKAEEVKATVNLPQVPERLKEQQRELIDSLDLNQ